MESINVQNLSARQAKQLLLLSSVVSLAVCWGGCSNSSGTSHPKLRFWHTFNAHESEALQEWLASTKRSNVQTTILPFARATTRFRSAVAKGLCPDLLRVDSTRIPGLVATNTIVEVPASVWKERKWLEEAKELVTYKGKRYGIPHSIDGLALVSMRKTGERSDPITGIHVDGYWFVPFLRQAGVALPGSNETPQIATEKAHIALDNFAQLFHSGRAVNLQDTNSHSRTIAWAFQEQELREVLTGPWDLLELSGGDFSSLEIRNFPHAPRGGQVLVVPSCSKLQDAAWQLALALTNPQLQSQWSSRLGLIPVTEEGLTQANPLVKEFYQALQSATPLPQHERVPELFDDLSPAVLAVVNGDATSEEALAGVQRSWQRLWSTEQ
jgi:maltose-binding protein MalE